MANGEGNNKYSQDELIMLYSESKVYCQLSLHESFGCALVEAMLCDCIPVVTNRGALPEIVGKEGYIIPFGNVNRTVEAIKEALNSYNKGSRTQGEKFSFTKRKEGLLRCIRK